MTDVEAIAAWAEEKNRTGRRRSRSAIGCGLADLLQARGVTVFGPTRAAAELEWSKAFAKDFMLRHGIPTARMAPSPISSCPDLSATTGAPLVVKADGLAAGKGVLICRCWPRRRRRFARCWSSALSAAGDQVIIEEFLEGRN